MVKQRSVEDAVDHLDRCARRAWGAAFQASESLAAWKVLNNDAKLRLGIQSSKTTEAAALIQNVLIEHQIIAVIRLFDSSRHERLSFPSAREHLDIEGVQEILEERARAWPGKKDKNVIAVRRRIKKFKLRLNRLESEEPNRQKRLRNHRDQNIAHELHFSEKKPPAYYGDIAGLLSESIKLTDDLGMAVLGMNWDWGTKAIEESVRALWQAAGSI